MKRPSGLFYIILIALISGALFYFISIPKNNSECKAYDGVLNLTGQSFEQIYPLSGEWEFYFGKLYTPLDFAMDLPEGKRNIHVPGSWSEGGYPFEGCATYRLIIRTDSVRRLMLFIPEINSASVVWVNGRKEFESGIVGTTKQTSRASVRNDLISFYPDNGQTEIVVQVSNYAFPSSGLYYSMRLGSEDGLLHDFQLERLLATFVLGGLLVIGAYHLILYRFRLSEPIFLCLGLLCFANFLRFFSDGNSLCDYFLPFEMGIWFYQFFFLCYIAQAIGIVIFAKLAFRFQFNRSQVILVILCYAVPVFVTVFFAPRWSAWSMLPLLIPHVIAIVKAARSNLLHGPYMLLYFVTLILFFNFGGIITSFYDNLFFLPELAPNLFMILSISTMLSYNYANAFNHVEETNTNLESIVADRTKELTNAYNAMKNMYVNIAHELKTPLTVVSGYAQLARRHTEKEEWGDEYIVEKMRFVQSEAERMAMMVSQLLETSHMEGNKIKWNFQKTDIQELIERMITVYFPVLNKYHNTIELALPDVLPSVLADREQVTQVMVNLIANALRFTKHGIITVSARKGVGEWVEIIVTDTGCGIDEEQLSQVFKRFYTTGREGDAANTGTGLGLYICRLIVEAHGGNIKIESEPGKGTIVSFSLRVYKESGANGDE